MVVSFQTFSITNLISIVLFSFVYFLLIQIMLLSLKAGGVGISLQGANHIVFIEPHPNPQLVAQAEDRIYRIGQEKQCYIYK